MRVHFLDVGDEKYGDCILIQHAGRSILIDGAHARDIEPRGTAPSIPQQLEELMGEPPFRPDLLVITHVHGDHIGCLPEMVARGLLEPVNVLAADEDWGSGVVEAGDADPLAGANSTARLIAEALLEEGTNFEALDDAREFVDRFVSPETSYREMLARFDQQIVWRYGREDVSGLESAFSDFGLKILGPTVDHLKICARFIASEKRKAAARARDLAVSDSSADLASLLYRVAKARNASTDALEDREGQGSAKNDQSIVISVGTGTEKVLLTGDMQLAKAEVPGLRDEMEALLEAVAKYGPYVIIKLPHHSSYNGADENELDVLGGDPILVHTGGVNDASHPESSILTMLKARLGAKRFLRTDRNGKISFDFESGEITADFDRGRWNNFIPNPKPRPSSRRDELALVPQPLREPEIKSQAASADQGFVEITARIPHVETSVTITVDVRPKNPGSIPKTGLDRPAPSNPLPNTSRRLTPAPPPGASIRALPKLLVLTNETALGQRIGPREAAQAIRWLEEAGLTVVRDMPPGIPEVDPALAHARQALSNGDFKGVVILGGYEVVPAVRLSVIDDALREQIEADFDDYIVWSDDAYGSLDDDGVPDVPVSRIPDAGSAELVFACLQSAGLGQAELSAFGLRNHARPFADRIFQQISPEPCLPSFPTLADQVPSEALRARHIYFMLHGHYIDGDEYTGEDDANGYPIAFTASRIPDKVSGVVFAGCCYGALLTRFPAVDTRPDRVPPSRQIDESIALTFLKAGAAAFVGCTAVHYSPPPDIPNTNGEPLHEAFWRHLLAGKTPAEALFEAKREYLPNIPHSGVDDAYEEAIELKIYSQFTCLGLGW